MRLNSSAGITGLLLFFWRVASPLRRDRLLPPTGMRTLGFTINGNQ